MPKKAAQNLKKSSKIAFSHSLEKTVAAYAAAAAAAGVTVLAMAAPASARIVFTPSNAEVDCFNTNLLIDMNGDGVADFRLSGYEFSYGHGSGRLVINAVQRPDPASAAAIGSLRYRGTYAFALTPGETISSKQDFLKLSTFNITRLASISVSNRHLGFFRYTTDRALGVRFKFTSPIVREVGVHYGWIGVQSLGDRSGQLSGWAYETVPNRPIKAGQTQEGSDDTE
jgi:hypothetical protein